MQNAEIAERRRRHRARVGMQTQVYVERAENAHVWDVEGRRYIDFRGGHLRWEHRATGTAKVMAAGHRQLDSFTPHLPPGVCPTRATSTSGSG
jgi:4-aminobutyrate aminotransferase